MKLNHLNLQVTDVQAARDFFETFFEFRCSYSRAELVILEDEAGFALAVSNLSGISNPQYPKDFHVGFRLDTVEEVKRLYDRLKNADIPINFDLQTAGPSLVFRCYGPDSILVEVSTLAS
ncbi:MAG TPA: VOC family protein [Coleofasciculaceae cyanobacterium]